MSGRRGERILSTAGWGHWCLVVAIAMMLAFAACAGPVADTGAAGAAEPVNPDLENLGPRDQVLFWTPEQQVAGYRNADLVGDARWFEASDNPYPLTPAPQDLSAVTYEVEGETFTVEEYIGDRRIAGLLVVKDDQVVFERYGLGNDENSRWISFSIAKSVVSMLYGAAIADGYIWGPFGMEADANWLLHEPAGGELGGCCINATLRDYARIGIFAMNGGVLRDGTRVLPEDWMEQSTTPSDGYDGYGYLWWLAGDGVFAGIGIFGQYLWMDPSSNIVIVTHSAWPYATNPEYSRHRAALVAALADAVR